MPEHPDTFGTGRYMRNVSGCGCTGSPVMQPSAKMAHTHKELACLFDGEPVRAAPGVLLMPLDEQLNCHSQTAWRRAGLSGWRPETFCEDAPRSARRPARRCPSGQKTQAATHSSARPERGSIFGNLSAHTDHERRGLDRIEEWRRKGLGSTRLSVPSDRHGCWAFGMLRDVKKKTRSAPSVGTSTLWSANPLLGSARTLKALISKMLQDLKQASKSLSYKL